jgi:hypothetical protein
MEAEQGRPTVPMQQTRKAGLKVAVAQVARAAGSLGAFAQQVPGARAKHSPHLAAPTRGAVEH